MSENIKLPFANSSHPRTDEEKLAIISKAADAYASFLDALGFDWQSDPNSLNTPTRVAKSFVNDLICGCYNDPPNITAFPNHEGYDGMVFQGGIPVKSICSHHHLPFIGVAHVAYIPSKEGEVIGLSKLNRIVEYFGRRPQIQEGLTMQIHDTINATCGGNLGVAVVVSATHTCACVRGIQHDGCEMKTSKLSGCFDTEDAARREFYSFIENMRKHQRLI